MTTTTLVLDWESDYEKLCTIAEVREKGDYNVSSLYANFKGYKLEFDPHYGCDVINVNSRLETMPDPLVKVPMKVIVLTKHNAPVTKAYEGSYAEDDILARVEAYGDAGIYLHHIRVEGWNGTTLERLNRWFDYLCDGGKNRCRRSSVMYSTETDKYLGRQ